MSDKFKDRVNKIKSVSDDIKYLDEEYSQSVLYGSAPGGDVRFESLMEWLLENSYNVEHMIKVARKIQELGGEL